MTTSAVQQPPNGVHDTTGSPPAQNGPVLNAAHDTTGIVDDNVQPPNVDHGSVTEKDSQVTTENGHAEGPSTNGSGTEGDDEEDSEDEDEDEDGDDDDEDDEPALKYERMTGVVTEVLEKDSASAIAISDKYIAFGTHNGVVHVLDLQGAKVKSYRAHSASVNDIRIDSANEFVATASMDGQAVIHSVNGNETFGANVKRPLRAIALDPQFSKRGTRAFVCGGMAGTVVMHEKGWLGNKETTIHSNEGPIWAIQWLNNLIAWADDAGVKIHDTNGQDKIMSIARPPNTPRADLFKCTLRWQDDTTLLIAWGDHIMIARMRSRSVRGGAGGIVPASILSVEVTDHFQVDYMLSGIVPYGNPIGSFLTLNYIPPDTYDNEETVDPAEQRRKAANRPEMQIISRSGEELSSDALSLKGFHLYGCNDYWLDVLRLPNKDPAYIVLSPKDIFWVRPRDATDHINWLVEREKYEEALTEVEKLGEGKGVNVSEIGRKYVEHLVEEGEFDKAAKLCSRVFGQNAKDWEDSVFIFAKKQQLQAIIPYVPSKEPQLDRLVYEMIIAYYLQNDRTALARIIKEWPNNIYDIPAVIVAVQSRLRNEPDSHDLMECLAELYMQNHQPGKALEYYLHLRKPNVFELIREHNLFVVVRDQVELLVDFDQELEKQRAEAEPPTPVNDKGKAKEKERSKAVTLLVDHSFVIPVAKVVQQLQARPYYLYMYLDALFDKDPSLASEFADIQVKLYAEYEPTRLIDFLRASNYYSLEKALKVCEAKDNLVPEQVFLLGRMGNNKKALDLIIEKLQDVNRAIDFAKEQDDAELWEDLLKYSETRPAFIRGLLENVGAEIDPIRLIRRIKNGLEIPGLKEALIKILWEFNLQVSLLEGCETILNSDGATLATRLQARQTNGYLSNAARPCPICGKPLFNTSLLLGSTSNIQQPPVILFLCRHMVHSTCVKGGDKLPSRPMDDVLAGFLGGANARSDFDRNIGAKIAYASIVRSRLEEGCPVCKIGSDGRGGHPE